MFVLRLLTYAEYDKNEWKAELAAALKGDGRVWGHVFDDLAENLERGEIRGAGLALRRRQCDGYAVRHTVSESATVTVDSRILHNPAVSDDKSKGKIDIGSVGTFAYRSRSDLLAEKLRG